MAKSRKIKKRKSAGDWWSGSVCMYLCVYVLVCGCTCVCVCVCVCVLEYTREMILVCTEWSMHFEILKN